MPVSSINYSIPYLLYLLVLVGLAFVELRRLKYELDTRYIRWAVILSFLVFFGLRGFVFTDWIIYSKLFEVMPTFWEGGLESLRTVTEVFEADVEVGAAGYEMGFILSTFLFKSLIPNYFVWVFVNTLVDIWLLDLFIRRYSPYYVLSFVVFVAMGGLIIECNLMRNVKAILLFMVSLKYIEERRLLPYLALNLLGAMFHSSAIIFIPLYFFLHKTLPRWLLWTVFVVGNVIFLLKISYLQPLLVGLAEVLGGRLGVQIKIYFALDMYNQPYGISLGYIERVATFLLLILLHRPLVALNNRNNLIINCYVIYFILFFFFSEVMIAVERLTLLFVFSYWVLYPLMYQLIKDTVIKWVSMIILVLFCSAKTITTSSSIFSRYDNLLIGIQDAETRRLIHDNNVDEFLKGRE